MGVFRALGIMLFVFLSTGCAIKKEPLSASDIIKIAETRWQSLYPSQPPEFQNLTQYDVLAKALSNNLEQRVRQLQIAVATKELDVAKTAMLPSVALSAGYTHRDNVAGSVSKNLDSGQRTNLSSTSQDRENISGRFDLSWNILDFGVGYLRAKQGADKVLIAEEQRRKAVQNLVQEVNYAYWKAIAAERTQKRLVLIIADIQKAIKTSQLLESQRLESPLKTLEYRKKLLTIFRQLKRIDERLTQARVNLAAFMNLPPSSQYSLVLPEEIDSSIAFEDYPTADLQLLALLLRPELREQAYMARVMGREALIEKLSVLPGITFSASHNYDENSFLLNENWATGSIQTSTNLIGLANLPKRKKLNKIREALQEAQTQALTVAITSQVALARKGYLGNKENYCLSKKIALIDRQRQQKYLAQLNSRTGTSLSLVQIRAEALLARLEQSQEYAELQYSMSRIINSVGINPLPADVSLSDEESIAGVLEEYFVEKLPDLFGGLLNNNEMVVMKDKLFGEGFKDEPLGISVCGDPQKKTAVSAARKSEVKSLAKQAAESLVAPLTESLSHTELMTLEPKAPSDNSAADSRVVEDDPVEDLKFEGEVEEKVESVNSINVLDTDDRVETTDE